MHRSLLDKGAGGEREGKGEKERRACALVSWEHLGQSPGHEVGRWGQGGAGLLDGDGITRRLRAPTLPHMFGGMCLRFRQTPPSILGTTGLSQGS